MVTTDNPRLTEKEKAQLAEIETIISDIKCGRNVNDNIKMLAIKHNVTKAYLQALRKPFLHPLDLEYIEDLNLRIWSVLEPVYNELTNVALNHLHQWYKRVRKASGELDPQSYKYQLDLIYWLLNAIIKNELSDALYTLLVSRGSGRQNLPIMVNL